MNIVRTLVVGEPLSYHLCPICGMPSDTSSRICSKHYPLIYDSSGKLIAVNGGQLVEGLNEKTA